MCSRVDQRVFRRIVYDVLLFRYIRITLSLKNKNLGNVGNI